MDDTDQTDQGGTTDDLMSRGREAAGDALNDPETRDRISGQAQERFGGVPGVDQATQAFGGGGSGGDAGGDYDTTDQSSSVDQGAGGTDDSQY